MKKAALLIIAGLMVVGVRPVSGAASNVRKIRVGVFHTEPLNFINENGVADGFNPDLLRQIAKEQNRWEPEFVPLNWAEGLAGLQDETIDLLMSTTYTAERAEVMDFSTEPVLDVWGQVFMRPGSGIESASNLEGRRVGIMKADAHGQNFVKLAKALGLQCNIVEEDTHDAVFEAVKNGEVDAAVVPSHFGLRHARRYQLVGTAVQFSPAPIFFSVKKGLHADVLADIDTVLSEWKNDEKSYYYRSFNYWFGGKESWAQGVPLWLKIVFGFTFSTTVLFLVLSWLFKRQVMLRTKELSQSEERYRLIVENQSDLVVKVDIRGRFLYVSPSYCEVFGKTEEELLQNTFLPLVHEEDRASTAVEFAKIFKPPHVAYMEQRAMTQKGWCWYSWQGSAILGEDGRVKEVIGIGRDITERKEAEGVYARTTERLRLATQAGRVGVWEYDLNQNKLIWDDQMFVLYDIDKQSFRGEIGDWERTLHPDDLESAKSVFQTAPENGVTFETEFRVLDRMKEVKYIRALAEVKQDASGHPHRVIGMNWDVTSQRKMVEALRSSEQDYRLLFENMTTGFMQVEVFKRTSGAAFDFCIAQINSAGCSMLKKEQKTLIGLTLQEAVGSLEDHWLEVLSNVARTGKASAYESRMESLGLVVSAWIFVPKPGHLAIVLSDNTARRKAEDAVLQAQQRLEYIVENTKDYLWQIDLKGNFIYANAAVEPMTGYSVDQILNMTVLDLMTPEYHEMARERIAARIGGNPGEDDYSFTIRCADGSIKWLELSTNSMLNEEDELIGVQGVARDVTFRKQAERELEESQQFLRAILDMIPVGVFWKDENLRYLGANRTFLNALGFRTSADIIGQDDFLIHVDRSMAEAFREIDQAVMDSGESRFNYADELVALDGTRSSVLTSKMPLKNAEGKTVGVLGAYIDVSEQVELEAHMRQAQKMDAVGRLAGGVAHDFNNILQSILGFSEILLGELDKDSSVYDDVSEIRKATRRAGNLTRQLLTLSRKHNVDYATQDLNAIIRANEKMMRRLIGERIEFNFNPGPNLKPVRADRSQVDQVILNLFINARDAMTEGGRLLVKTYNVEEDNELPEEIPFSELGYICLDVSDTGSGIREDVREHLFEPFFTTKQVGEGTGLGLSVVYGIVQQHGGHIDVSSQIGKGSAFKVYLPACGPGEISAPDDEPRLDSDPSLVGGHGESVLVVEDDSVLRDLTKRMLTNAGYTVTVASNVKEATGAMESTTFDLLLVDLVLTDGSGLDLVRAARSAGGDFAVLLCSGYPQEGDVYETMKLNGFQYFEKPIGSMQLLQSVREMLDEKHSV